MGTEKMTRRAAALLLALALAAGLFPAALAEQPAAPAPMDVDLIMAKNAIAGFGVKGADGKAMEPRHAPEKRGRGLPDETGVEPDYRGVVGYASLQADWEVSRFNTFTQTPWQLPVYEEKGGEFKAAKDSIKHKTPVLVIDQQIREAKGHKFIGYLKVVRLDIHRIVWIDGTKPGTSPWTGKNTAAPCRTGSGCSCATRWPRAISAPTGRATHSWGSSSRAGRKRNPTPVPFCSSTRTT